MKKDGWIKTRITTEQAARVRELGQVTGMNTSQLMRVLIDNARLEMRPAPTTTVTFERNEGGASVSQAQRAALP